MQEDYGACQGQRLVVQGDSDLGHCFCNFVLGASGVGQADAGQRCQAQPQWRA